MNEKEFYNKIKDWNFDKYEIISENLTDWDLYDKLKKITNINSKILDLGTGGGEKVLTLFPSNVNEIIATDFSEQMINTANQNLKLSGKKNIAFRVMDNLNMDTKKEYFDVVVARNTVTDPKQIYETLKPNGYLLIRGVDKYDCYELKKFFGKSQAYFGEIPISITDYNNVLDAGFKDAELIPLHVREYFKSKEVLLDFMSKVPILYNFNDYLNEEIDQKKLDQYIKRNTYKKGIRLVRRYYGIIGKK